MAAFLSPTPTLRFYVTNGHPLAGGYLITYDQQTSQTVATWSDPDMQTPNPVQIPLDANGEPVVDGVNVGIFLEEGKIYKYRWFDKHGTPIGESDSIEIPKTSIDDNSLTFQKLEIGTLNFVTPEMFGAVGNGVADDTGPVQAAINTGLPVIGRGVYRVGPQYGVYTNCLEVNNSSYIRLDIIDNRFYARSNNQTNKGVFLVNSDNVTIIGNITNENNLPSDSVTADDLSNVGGYAVVFGREVHNCKIDINITHMNGVSSDFCRVIDSDIRVVSKYSGYPNHIYCFENGSMKIECDTCHRAFWGSLKNADVIIKSKNFYSTGDSAHVLLCSNQINGVNYLCENSKMVIIDGGSTNYNANASYLIIDNQTAGSTIEVSLNVEFIGDISNGNNGVMRYSNSNTLTGHVFAVNNMKTSNSRQPTRLYNGIDTVLIESVENNVWVNTTANIVSSFTGCSTGKGSVVLSGIGASSKINVSGYFRCTTSSTSVLDTDAYQDVVVTNVFTFNPAEIKRCMYLPLTKYLNGNVVT